MRKPRSSAGFSRGMHRFLHLPATQAGGANPNAFAGAIHDRPDGPQVHVPTPLGNVVSVADVVSKLRSLTAHVACLCHETLQTVDSIAASGRLHYLEMMRTERAILRKISSLGNQW